MCENCQQKKNNKTIHWIALGWCPNSGTGDWTRYVLRVVNRFDHHCCYLDLVFPVLQQLGCNKCGIRPMARGIRRIAYRLWRIAAMSHRSCWTTTTAAVRHLWFSFSRIVIGLRPIQPITLVELAQWSASKCWHDWPLSCWIRWISWRFWNWWDFTCTFLSAWFVTYHNFGVLFVFVPTVFTHNVSLISWKWRGMTYAFVWALVTHLRLGFLSDRSISRNRSALQPRQIWRICFRYGTKCNIRYYL